MTERGKSTAVPGLSRDGENWILRARAKRPGVKIEREKRYPLTELSLGEAVVALEKLKAEVRAEAEEKARGQSNRPLTLGEWTPRWLESLVIKKKGATKREFFKTRGYYLKGLILPYLGKIRMKDLRPTHIEEWKLWLVEQLQPQMRGKAKNPRAGQAYARETLKSVWSTARMLLRWASKMAGTSDPMANELFDIEAGQKRRKKESLEQDELALFVAAATPEEPNVRAMVILGFYSGMRFCELSALEWKRDINLEAGVLRINKSQVRGELGEPKTEETRRTVYLDPLVIAVLREYRAWQVAMRIQGFERDLVFPNRDGSYFMSTAALRKPLARCCERAGIDKHITSHCLRTTSTNLYRQAKGEVAARLMVGHSVDSKMTERYSEVHRTERIDAARAAFGDALGRTKAKPAEA